MSLKAKISADGTQYVKELERLRGQTAKFAGSVKGLLAGAFGITGIISLTRQTIAFGSEMSDLATRTRTTVKEFMVFRDVARDAGVAQNVLERAMRNVVQRTQAAIDGNKSYAQSIERLGLNLNEFGKLTTKDQLVNIANAFHNAENEAEAFRDVAVILGERAGPMLTEVLRRIAIEGYDKLADAAVTMSDATAASLDKAEDSIQKFKESVTIFVGTTLIGFRQWGRGIKAAFEGVVIYIYSLVSDVSGAMSSFLDAFEKFFTGDTKGAKQAFDKMMNHYVDAGTRAADKVREHWDEALKFEQPTLTRPGANIGSDGFDADEREKIEEQIVKLKQQAAAEDKKAQEVGLSNAEKARRVAEDRKQLEQEIKDLKATPIAGTLKEQLKIAEKELDLKKLITEEANATKKAIEDQTKAAQSLADIYERIAELQGRPGAGAQVEAGEQAIIERLRKEQALKEKTEAGAISLPEKKQTLEVELEAKKKRQEELKFEMEGFVAFSPDDIKKFDALADEAKQAEADIESLEDAITGLAVRINAPEEFELGKQIEDAQAKLSNAQQNMEKIAASISGDISAGLDIDEASFNKLRQLATEALEYESAMIEAGVDIDQSDFESYRAAIQAIEAQREVVTEVGLFVDESSFDRYSELTREIAAFEELQTNAKVVIDDQSFADHQKRLDEAAALEQVFTQAGIDVDSESFATYKKSVADIEAFKDIATKAGIDVDGGGFATYAQLINELGTMDAVRTAAGLDVDTASFDDYKKAQEDVAKFEAELARLKETERKETLEYTEQIKALRAGLADAKKKEADALAALQVEPTDDPVKKMQAASGELIRLEKELDALRKKSLEDGEQSAEERQAIAEKEFELVQKIADAVAETTQIRGEIEATRAAGEEAGMSDIQKLEAANKRQEQLEGQLAALQKAADADGRRTAEEELAIAQKRLEIEQGIADAKTVIAGAKEEIESRRRAREEEALSPEELLARREKESAAARRALRGARAAAGEDVTEAEQAIISTKQLDVEKALDAEMAARKALEGQKADDAGVVASSLAAIGGGGGVASFTQDPLLSENKRQTQVLEAIRDSLRGAEQLDAAKGLKLPEL